MHMKFLNFYRTVSGQQTSFYFYYMMSEHKQKNYFRLLKPIPSKSPRFISPDQSRDSLEKQTMNIVKNKKYVYIDFLQQSTNQGVKQMEKVPEVEDEQCEQIGKTDYMCDSKNLSPMSQKSIQYFEREKEFKKQKMELKKLFKKKLDETTRNNKNIHSLIHKKKSPLLYQYGKSSFDHIKVIYEQDESGEKEQVKIASDNISKIINRHVNKNKSTLTIDHKIEEANEESQSSYQKVHTQKLKKLLMKKELKNLSSAILDKEKQLIRKYGFTNEYESITHRRSPIVRDNDARKVYLPGIKSDYGFSY